MVEQSAKITTVSATVGLVVVADEVAVAETGGTVTIAEMTGAVAEAAAMGAEAEVAGRYAFRVCLCARVRVHMRATPTPLPNHLSLFKMLTLGQVVLHAPCPTHTQHNWCVFRAHS